MAYVYLFITAFSIAFLTTPVVKAAAGRLGIVAKPKEDRWHKKVIPLMGGIAIFTAFMTTYLIFMRGGKVNMGLVVGGASIFLLGVVDDIRGLSPQTKLVGQIVCASLAVMFGVSIKVIPFAAISVPITILWMVGITNSFNLLDNMDGLSAGVTAIASLTLFACSLALHSYEIAMVSLIMAGASLGFLPHNFYPARIFMGDCGAMFLGFTLSALTIMGTWKEVSHLFLVLLVPVLALAVPIFDTLFVAVTRTIDGRSVSKGGRDHTSHRMVFLGWQERKAVTVLYAISILFGAAAYVSLHVKIYVSAVILSLLVLVVSVFAIFLNHPTVSRRSVRQPGDKGVSFYKNESELIEALVKYKRVIFEVICDFVLICLAYMSSYIMRYEGIIDHYNFGLIAKSLPIIIVIKLLAFSVSGVYG
nr:undecaprenyl/decaprenyl-phosphate alpha-N-acetylglucosaminyl 1-phosphate transferase [Candidatus Omnitrophota bacterium]